MNDRETDLGMSDGSSPPVSPPRKRLVAPGGAARDWRGTPVAPKQSSPAFGWRGPSAEQHGRDRNRFWRWLVLGATATGLVAASAALVIMLLPDTKTPLLAIVATGYDFPIPPNAFAREDAEILRALGDGGVGSWLPGRHVQFTTHVREIEDNGANESPADFVSDLKEDVKSARSRTIRSNKPLVIYLSMHGVERDGKAYLLLPGADPWAAEPASSEDWVSMDSILTALCDPETSGSASVMLLLDCERIGEEPAMGVVSNGFEKSLSDLWSTEKSSESNLGKAITSGRLVILCSAKDGQVAWASPGLGGSVFGRFAAAGLAGYADRNQDKKVQISELVVYVTAKVSGWSSKNRPGYPQTPWVLRENPESSSVGDETLVAVHLDAFQPPTPASAAPSTGSVAEQGDPSPNGGQPSTASAEGEAGVAEAAPSIEERIEEKWKELDEPDDKNATPWYRYHPVKGAMLAARLRWLEQALLAGAAYQGDLQEVDKLPAIPRDTYDPGLPALSVCLTSKAKDFHDKISADKFNRGDLKTICEALGALDPTPVEYVLAQWIYDHVPKELLDKQEHVEIIRDVLGARATAERAALGPRGGQTDPRVFLKVTDGKVSGPAGFLTADSDELDNARRCAEDWLFVGDPKAVKERVGPRIADAKLKYKNSIDAMEARESAYRARDKALARVILHVGDVEWHKKLRKCVQGLASGDSKKVDDSVQQLISDYVDVENMDLDKLSDPAELWDRLQRPPSTAAGRGRLLASYLQSSLAKDGATVDYAHTSADENVGTVTESSGDAVRSSPGQLLMKLADCESPMHLRKQWNDRQGDGFAAKLKADSFLRLAAPFAAGFANSETGGEIDVADQEIQELSAELWKGRREWQADRMFADLYGRAKEGNRVSEEGDRVSKGGDLVFYKEAREAYLKGTEDNSKTSAGSAPSTDEGHSTPPADTDSPPRDPENPFVELQADPILPFDDALVDHRTGLKYSKFVNSGDTYLDEPMAEIVSSGTGAFWILADEGAGGVDRIEFSAGDKDDGGDRWGQALDLSKAPPEIAYAVKRNGDELVVRPFVFWRGWTAKAEAVGRFKPDYVTRAESVLTGKSFLNVSTQDQAHDPGTVMFVLDFSVSMLKNNRFNEAKDILKSTYGHILEAQKGIKPYHVGLIAFGHERRYFEREVAPYEDVDTIRPATLLTPEEASKATKIIDSWDTPHGDTPLYRSLLHAIEEVSKSDNEPPYKIIVISDGGDSETWRRDQIELNPQAHGYATKAALPDDRPKTPDDIDKKIDRLDSKVRDQLTITLVSFDGTSIRDANSVSDPDNPKANTSHPELQQQLDNLLHKRGAIFRHVEAKSEDLLERVFEAIGATDIRCQLDGQREKQLSTVGYNVEWTIDKSIVTAAPDGIALHLWNGPYLGGHKFKASVHGDDDVVKLTFHGGLNEFRMKDDDDALFARLDDEDESTAVRVSLRRPPAEISHKALDITFEDANGDMGHRRPKEVLVEIENEDGKRLVGYDPCFLRGEALPAIRIQAEPWPFRADDPLRVKVRFRLESVEEKQKMETRRVPLGNQSLVSEGFELRVDNELVRLRARCEPSNGGTRIMVLEDLGDQRNRSAFMIQIVDESLRRLREYEVDRKYFPATNGSGVRILHVFDVKAKLDDVKKGWHIEAIPMAVMMVPNPVVFDEVYVTPVASP